MFDDEFTPSWSVCPRSVERCRLVAAARRFSFGQLEDDTIVCTAGEGEDVFAGEEAGVILELFLFDSGKRAEKSREWRISFGSAIVQFPPAEVADAFGPS
jgi:hypothetical protein